MSGLLSHYKYDLEFSEQQLVIVQREQNPIPHMEWNLVKRIIWLRVEISKLIKKEKR